MTNPPKEITTAPEGYEWAGPPRGIGHGEYYAQWQIGGWRAAYRSALDCSHMNFPPLRKTKPPTVTVELLRDVVDFFALMSWYDLDPNVVHDPLLATTDACRAALEQED